MTEQARTQTQAVWELDQANTHIGFAVKHMMVSTTRGRFTEFHGFIFGSPDDPINAWAAVTIDAASIDTGNERRDEHLRSADFLDVERYPTITYKSTHVEQTGDDLFRVTGNLTIRDITKEVELEVRMGEVGETPSGQEKVDLTANGSLSRTAWEVKWNIVLDAEALMIGDTVRVDIEVEAVKQAQTVDSRQASHAAAP